MHRPPFARAQTGRLAKCGCKAIRSLKAASKGHLYEGEVRLHKQLTGALYPDVDQVSVRRLARSLSEGASELRLAQAGHSREIGEQQSLAHVGVHVFEDAFQTAGTHGHTQFSTGDRFAGMSSKKVNGNSAG